MTEPSGIEAAALKPCPFCGSKSVAQGATGKQTISVWCMGCGTRGPDVPFPDFCDSVAQISLSHQRWNTRARPGASGDLREVVAARVTDNDRDEITVTLDGKELRGWSYSSDQERRTKMLCARDFVEGFCTGRQS